MPAFTVNVRGIELKRGEDFSLAVCDAMGKRVETTITPGVYVIKVFGKGAYQGEIESSYVIQKAPQRITVKISGATYRAKKLKKVKSGGSFLIGAKAKTPLKYSVSKKARKAGVSVTAKGKVKVKRTCKKGTYTVNIKTSGNANYEPATRTITVKVK